MSRDPLTVAQVRASRMVCDPLTVRDCCLVTDGAGAIVMVSSGMGELSVLILAATGIALFGVNQTEPVALALARSTSAYLALFGWLIFRSLSEREIQRALLETREEAEKLAHSRGLQPEEARRHAAVAFGGVEKFKEAGRDVRGLRWLDSLSLDARLGLRMLIKHRGLTLVGGFAMAVAIAVAATAFEAFSQVLDPALPVAPRRPG